MQALSLALLYLGSVSFFGLEAAKLDLASEFKRNLILEPANLHSRRHTSPPSPPLSHLNVVRLGCRLGTCHAHNLLDMVFHLMDKRKESAPQNKVHEYGRRRRRGDLVDTFAALFTRSLSAYQHSGSLHYNSSEDAHPFHRSGKFWTCFLKPFALAKLQRRKREQPRRQHTGKEKPCRSRLALTFGRRDLACLHPSQWIINSIRMQALPLALLYLGSVSFFGLEAAKLDLASDFKRKWNKWVRRDLNLAVEPLLRPQDGKDEPGMAQQPRLIPEPVHLRSRRHARQATPALSHLNVVRLGCRLGTCNTHNLAHMIFHLTDKEKDSSAPPNKIHDYGRRRRRRDLGDTFAARFTRSLGAHQRAGSLH
ncbi:pro-adrenomedullin [Anolis sagrei]|uniref:pro-adrenomedullin n=1 Tax=Anolis sagrei TaxID=38937 RepID=UPI003521CFF5